jgi:hypothetical protein
MQDGKDCKCTVSAADPLCGKHDNLTQMEREIKIQPRMFMPTAYHQGKEEDSSDSEYGVEPKPLQKKKVTNRYSANGKMIEDEGLQSSNRKTLRKFEALNISGRTLTGLSIGGYEVDLNVAAQKAMEILPMPPAKLPVIFIDEELNFLHHFFQGVTQILGENALKVIASKRTYYEDESPVILNMIEDLILEGYDKSDKEIIVFLKKVLQSTFETTSQSRKSRGNGGVRVCANLWGFQYIECGMVMEEQDLQMWLSVSYNQYRTSWFNTFKSSGVPGFAVEGSGKTRSLSSISSSSNSDRVLETLREQDEESVVSRRTHSSKKMGHKGRHRKNSNSTQSHSAVIKYLSGQ